MIRNLSFILLLLVITACGQAEREQVQQQQYEMELRQQVAEADVEIYPNPGCMCCAKWADHLEDNGFTVRLATDRHPADVKEEYGIEPDLHSCHTAIIGDYVIEGHVPAEAIKKLLAETPEATGLAVPDMPMGSPGMEGAYSDPYDVILFDGEGNQTVYARY